MPLLLTENDVRSVLPMTVLIESMRSALAAYSTGRALQPLRTVLELGDGQAFFGVMPASLGASRAVGTKLVTVVPSNHGIGLPSHLATIVLLDPSTGSLLALLDGRYITEARTAAVSAVSADVLGRPDAGVLAILGSGVQARSHLEALRCVRPIREVRVWSPTAAHRETFAVEMAARTGLRVDSSESAATAVAGADLIVVATSATTPVIQSNDVADGVHICAIGACRPVHRELTADLVARSRLFVDSRVGAIAEAGDIVMALQEGAIGSGHIAGELGELISGNIDGRQNGHQVTIFKSLGMAVEDVAAAHLAYTRAQSQGIGRQFTL